MKLFSLICALVLLSGCSSAPVAISHYVFDTELDHYRSSTASSSVHVQLNSLQLADYLDHGQLAMLASNNQLILARRHIWAEPLSDGVRRALINDVNGSGKIQLVDRSHGLNIATDWRLDVSIDHMVPTDNALVVLAGRLWLTDNKDKKNEYPFYFSHALEQDGYAHAVAIQRQLVKELAQFIQQKVMEPNLDN